MNEIQNQWNINTTTHIPQYINKHQMYNYLKWVQLRFASSQQITFIVKYFYIRNQFDFS